MGWFMAMRLGRVQKPAVPDARWSLTLTHECRFRPLRPELEQPTLPAS
nr:hypothetical protein Q903MT_gene6108 [Picea sitchensis]